MKVKELIVKLQAFNPDWDVHLDISADDEEGWEGDRAVRHCIGVRVQAGHEAIALDGSKESA